MKDEKRTPVKVIVVKGCFNCPLADYAVEDSTPIVVCEAGKLLKPRKIGPLEEVENEDFPFPQWCPLRNLEDALEEIIYDCKDRIDLTRLIKTLVKVNQRRVRNVET